MQDKEAVAREGEEQQRPGTPRGNLRGSGGGGRGTGGAGQPALAWALDYAKVRQQFGKPIIDFQLIQAMLADSRAETYAARSMVLDASKRFDRGERLTMEAACCKYFCTEMVGRVADRAVGRVARVQHEHGLVVVVEGTLVGNKKKICESLMH